MARVAKALLAAALIAISPEETAGTMQLLSKKMMKKLGWKGKKDHHGAARRLSEDPELSIINGIWINEIKNNVVFPEFEDLELETECDGPILVDCPPVGPVDFFEVVWGYDINITEHTFTQYDALTGDIVSTYKMAVETSLDFFDDEDGMGAALGILYPSLPDVQGLSISKDCSGEFIECVSYGPTPFTGADGAECVSTGVMDPGFLEPISIFEAIDGGLSVGRDGFCPDSSWSLQNWTIFSWNPAQLPAVDAYFEDGAPLPVCPSYPCEPAVESCPRCKSLCAAKAGFDLEPYPRGEPSGDGPNCEPSTGGWRCCVLRDFDGNRIYERGDVGCYCAGRRRTSLGSSGED